MNRFYTPLVCLFFSLLLLSTGCASSNERVLERYDHEVTPYLSGANSETPGKAKLEKLGMDLQKKKISVKQRDRTLALLKFHFFDYLGGEHTPVAIEQVTAINKELKIAQTNAFYECHCGFMIDDPSQMAYQIK